MRRRINIIKIKNCILLVAAVVIYFITFNALFGYSCLFMAILGIPCISCGMTRAAVLFLTGNFKGSFFMHPLFVFVALFVLAYGVLKLRAAFPELFGRFGAKPISANILFKPLIVLVIIGVVVYIIRMIVFFPHTAPMVYNERALVNLILKVLSNGNGFV